MQTVVHFWQPPTSFEVHRVLDQCTIAIRDGANPDAALQIHAGDLDALLAIAEGIRNAVHVAQMQQLGHDIAVAP